MASKYDAAGNIIRGLVDETALGGKLASDPRIQGIIAKNMAGMDPALAARVRAGDPSATLEAYQSIVAGGGRMPARQMELPMGDNQSTAMIPYGERGPGVPVGGSRGPGMSGDRVAAHKWLRDSWPLAEDADEADVLAALPEFAPEQRQYLQALQANDWLGFDYPSQAASSGLMADAGKRWEMSPDLVAARQSLINSRLRGPGVPGDLSGPGVRVAGERGLAVQAGSAGSPRGLSTDVRLPRLGSRMGVPVGPASDPLDEWIASQGRQVALRPDGVRSPPPGASAGWQRLANSPAGRIAGGVGIAAGGMGAIDLMMPNENGDPPAQGSSTADLAAESRPIPSVESTPDEAPAMPPAPSVPEAAPPAPDMPPDYSFQARELMNKLNAMRRQAGGEVPEAPQMMAEINRLLGMSNKQRNAPGYQPAMPTDHHGQAQMLLQKLNAMRMEAGGEVPEAQQIMAEVRRHQAMGDQMRNAR